MLNEKLKKEIEKVYGQETRYSKDCEALAAEVSQKTEYNISSTTVKRLLGFAKTESKPSLFTLDIIAIYLGYKSYEDLEISFSNPALEQNELLETEIQPKNEIRETTFVAVKPKKPYLKYVFVTAFLLGLTCLIYLMTNQKGTLELESLANMPEPRNGGKAVVNDDFIYYIGGANASFVQDNCWRYSVKSNKWEELVQMQTARAEQATALVNGKIYVFGGWLGNSFGMTDRAEVYNITSNQWDTLPPLPVKTTSASAVAYGDDIYILGGTTGETTVYFLKFNTLNKAYESLPTFNAQMMYGSMVLVNNKIYVMGGNSYVKFEYRWHNNFFEYDIDKKVWVEKPPMPAALTAGCAVVKNNKIHLLGGKDTYGDDDKGIKQSHFIYDIATDTWEKGKNLPYSICTNQSVLVNGKVYLIGGMTNFPNPTNKVVRF